MAADARAPHAPELIAPPAWTVIDFISDLHLGEDTPRGLDTFAAYLRDTPADAVFILGDLFEVWIGDDARHDDFESRCAALLNRAGKQRQFAFMAGNRDFLVGHDMLQASAMTGLQDPTVLVAQGLRVLLTHGDALCVEDTDYQQFRAQVRGAVWQRDFLAQDKAVRRQQARQMRMHSRALQQSRPPELWADVDTSSALQWLEAAAAPLMIHGHTHRPGRVALAPGFAREVLSDWDLDHAGTPRAEALRLQAGTLRRVPLAAG